MNKEFLAYIIVLHYGYDNLLTIIVLTCEYLQNAYNN